MAKTARTRGTYHVGNLAPQLLSAARAMLDDVGLAKLSLRAVTERVGVSSTAAYHHFANRAELVTHLAVQGFHELAQAMAERDPQAPDDEKLRQATLAYVRFARANPALYQLMFGTELGGSAEVAELKQAREASFGELKKIIAELLGKDMQSAEVRTAALAGWSYTHGLASLVIHNVLPADDERYVDRTLQGFDYLFKARSAG
ncbi:MAG: TetR/AcrR family transcriptional regulator [Burkholderiaceae bacterium]|nr:TetR/AcrR family transcriptional regulator [Burkholderiaceae bacterium]